jgi:hypothetical protein
LSFLPSSPTPQQIIDFHTSDAAQQRLRDLLEANRQGKLSDDEQAELEETSRINHVIILPRSTQKPQRLHSMTSNVPNSSGNDLVGLSNATRLASL